MNTPGEDWGREKKCQTPTPFFIFTKVRKVTSRRKKKSIT